MSKSRLVVIGANIDCSGSKIELYLTVNRLLGKSLSFWPFSQKSSVSAHGKGKEVE